MKRKMYVVMRLHDWSTLEVKGGVLGYVRVNADDLPGCGFLSVHETYEEAEAEYADMGGADIIEVEITSAVLAGMGCG